MITHFYVESHQEDFSGKNQPIELVIVINVKLAKY